MAEHIIHVDHKKCIGCGLCVKDCVAHNIELRNHNAYFYSNNCVMCGHCAAVCPQEAVTISGYETEPLAIEQPFQLNPEEVLHVIRSRRSIRQFLNKDIPDHILAQILEAGRMTHTAKNLQDVSFIVLDKERAKLEHLAVNLFRKIKPLADLFRPMSRRIKIDSHFFFYHAPKVIVILSKDEINGALAAQNMEFVAEANGLGVLYSGFFSIAANFSVKIRKELRIPRGKKVITTLVLGYPRVQYQRTAQREKLNVRYL